MSLDVHLTFPDKATSPAGSGIFFREGGQTKEITRAEWDEKFPGCEPIIVVAEGAEVYWRNITHNLNKMATEAGIYKYLWRPDEINITTAAQLIEPLTDGLALLESDPARFKKLNPPNGWGDYDGLVDFTRDYLAACQQYPAAEIYASR